MKIVLLLVFLSCRMGAQLTFKHPARSYVYNLRPEVRIPVESLGYEPPGELPAFQYYSLVSLRYVDASHLLFTFNTTGLMRRDDQCSGGDAERMVRAVVLDLPSGKVANQTEWKLYDFSDFLWPLGNGQFILRRCSQLDRVDSALTPTPFISLGGSLRYMSFSPDHALVLVEEKPMEQTSTSQQNAGGSNPSLSQQSNSMISNHPEPELNIDFIRIHPLAVIARAHAASAGEFPILSQGFLEMMGASHGQWDVILKSYNGSQQQVAAIRSSCMPELTAITDNMFVAQMCPKSDQMAYQGYNLHGTLLWQFPFRPDRVLPRFILTQNGAHFAIETLHASHPRAALDPLGSEGIDGEIIDVYDTLTGTQIANFRTTPVYTGGRNVDFSPDGTRMAVLHDGAIEIYDLNALAKSEQARPR